MCQLLGDRFDGVVQEVADVTDRQAGTRADLFVGKILVKFEAHQFATAFIERFEAEAHQADTFPTSDLLVGQGLGVLYFMGRASGFIGGDIQGNDFGRRAPLVQRQIMNRPVKPLLRLFHRFKLGVKFHERFLHDILRQPEIARVAQRITQ